MTPKKTHSGSICCERCFDEPCLVAFIKDTGNEGCCDYCSNVGVATVPLGSLAQFVDEGIDRAYEPARLYEDSAFGVDATNVNDILVQHIELRIPMRKRKRFLADLVAFSTHQESMVRCNNPDGDAPSGHNDFVTWEFFCKYIKTRRRFTQFLPARSGDSVNGLVHEFQRERRRILERFWEEIPMLVESQIKSLEVGTLVERAQLLRPRERPTHKRMTAPPPIQARNGRMNPAGIPYFYGALEVKTAVAEVRPYVGARVGVAHFEVTKPLQVLDVANLPAARSIFCKDYRYYIEDGESLFLRLFAESISRPVQPDDEPVDYVPTQAFCEYLHLVGAKTDVHGILFKSAMRDGGTNITLFRGPKISMGPNPWLEFKDAEIAIIESVDYQWRSKKRAK